MFTIQGSSVALSNLQLIQTAFCHPFDSQDAVGSGSTVQTRVHISLVSFETKLYFRQLYWV